MKIDWTLAEKIYKGTRIVVRNVLRFFNLLEPDVPYMVLSVSKLSVWATLGLTLYVVGSGKGTDAVAGALLTNIGSVANYAYRRHVQVKTGTGAYAGSEDSDSQDDSTDADAQPEPDVKDGQ